LHVLYICGAYRVRAWWAIRLYIQHKILSCSLLIRSIVIRVKSKFLLIIWLYLFQIPSRLIVWESLPRNAMGKVSYFCLHDNFKTYRFPFSFHRKIFFKI
jgi:hypothetical protein